MIPATLNNTLQGNVLLVEDDALFGAWAQESLNSLGLKVDLKVDLESALSATQNKFYHAIITDIYLSPEGGKTDGLDLLRQIESSGIPTIMMSSRADLSIAKEAVNHGASYILEKPFSMEEVTNALRNMWEQPRGLQALLERFMEINSLTPKEREVTRLVIKGLANKEIASVEETTDRTVKAHLTNIFQKCGVESRTELFNAIFPT